MTAFTARRQHTGIILHFMDIGWVTHGLLRERLLYISQLCSNILKPFYVFKGDRHVTVMVECDNPEKTAVLFHVLSYEIKGLSMNSTHIMQCFQGYPTTDMF